MPELPEVETVARQLAPEVEGLRIEELIVLDPKLLSDSLPFRAGFEISTPRFMIY